MNHDANAARTNDAGGSVPAVPIINHNANVVALEDGRGGSGGTRQIVFHDATAPHS